MRINLKDGSFVEMNDDGFWSGYDDVMGEISAEQLVTQILEVGVIDSVHETNNTKIKVSKAVAGFIDDYARNMSYDENWKDKLLMDHSITYCRGFDGYNEKVKVLKDITPMKMAEILHNGYEIEDRYTRKNLPNHFKFKHGQCEIGVTNVVIYRDIAYVAFPDETETRKLDDVVRFLNEESWIIIE